SPSSCCRCSSSGCSDPTTGGRSVSTLVAAPADVRDGTRATPPRARSRRPRDRVASVVLHVVLVAGLLAMVAPFIWMLLSSFKSEGEIREVPPTWWPHDASWTNYRELFERLNFPTYFANSTLVAVVVTVGNLLICSATAYALAKLPFPGRRWIFA